MSVEQTKNGERHFEGDFLLSDYCTALQNGSNSVSAPIIADACKVVGVEKGDTMWVMTQRDKLVVAPEGGDKDDCLLSDERKTTKHGNSVTINIPITSARILDIEQGDLLRTTIYEDKIEFQKVQ